MSDIISTKCWNQYESDFIIEELNLHIAWNSKNATNILVYLIKLFNMPHTLNLNNNGLAHFIKYNIKDKVYYDQPIIWNEIIINDEYIYDTVNKTKNVKPLYCYYYKELSISNINKIAGLNIYGIWYDNNKQSICINTNNFKEAHYIIKITLDILNDHTIDINKYISYLKSVSNKYKTKKEINMLIYKIYMLNERTL